MDIAKLLAVLEAAKEGSEYLDYAIQRLSRTTKPVPAYTRSVDAALSLLPEGWSVHRLTRLTDCRGGFGGWIGEAYRAGEAVIRYPAIGTAATAPLALCLAALRVHRGEMLREQALAEVQASPSGGAARPAAGRDPGAGPRTGPEHPGPERPGPEHHSPLSSGIGGARAEATDDRIPAGTTARAAPGPGPRKPDPVRRSGT